MIRKRVCLFFGSFNPIHYCHVKMCEVLLERNMVDEVWITVSRKNPFKESKTLMDKQIRIQCVKEILKHKDERLIAANDKFEGFNSIYTCDAIEWLKNKYPNYDFSMLIGEDLLEKFDGWKNYQYILDNVKIFCFFRDAENKEMRKKYPDFTYLEDIGNTSATDIRKAIKRGENPDNLTCQKIIDLYKEHINEIEIEL